MDMIERARVDELSREAQAREDALEAAARQRAQRTSELSDS